MHKLHSIETHEIIGMGKQHYQSLPITSMTPTTPTLVVQPSMSHSNPPPTDLQSIGPSHHTQTAIPAALSWPQSNQRNRMACGRLSRPITSMTPYHIHPSCPIVHVSLQPTTHRRPIHRSTEITRYAVTFQSLSGASTISRRPVYSIAFRMRES